MVRFFYKTNIEKEMCGILEEFDIFSTLSFYKTKNPKWRNSFQLRINGLKNLKKFNKFIGFNIKRKQSKLERYLYLKKTKGYFIENK